MRTLAGTAVVAAIALSTSACAGGQAAHHVSATIAGTKTDAIQLQETGYNALPIPLQNFIRSLIASPGDGPANEIDVYGPGSRAALVKASSGEVVVGSAHERKERFYLIVLHCHFVCRGCSTPAGGEPPRGTIETHVWSQAEGSTDFGIGNRLPAAVSHFHRQAVLTLS